MAAIWTVKIDVTNVAEKTMTVTATRTDGLDVRVYTLAGLSYNPTPGRNLAAIRGEIVNVLYAMYAKQLALTTESAAIAVNEGLMATALNAKEA